MMDTIEFRSMNSSIQAEANAAFVQPSQAYTENGRSGSKPHSGCNDCGKNNGYGRNNGYDKSNGHDQNNDYDRNNGFDRNNGHDKNNGYDQNNDYDRNNGGCRSNSCETRNENRSGKYNGNNGGQYTRNGHIYYNGCEEVKVNEMDDKEIEATGRIMDVTMTLKNVCPCRRVSVGYLVTEMDEENNEHSCGFKCFTVPAHYNSECCDVEVERTRFILPDDARVDGCTGHCSGRRHFIVRAEAHYADSNVTMP